MLNNNLYFKPYNLPVENPYIDYNGYSSKPSYEYLVFKEYY